MRLSITLCLLISVLLMGCSKRPLPEKTPVPQAPAPSAAVSVDGGNAPPPPPPPSAEATDAPAEAQGPREAPMDLDSLNSILSGYIVATDKVPKTFEEMVKLKLIPRVPTPPAGKKYVIDPVSQKVRVVNK